MAKFLQRYYRLALVLGVGAVVAGVIIFVITYTPNNTITPARQLSAALWQSYLKQQWLSEGRTVSMPTNSITTSESQSYTMLRAVWENDPSVFQTTWSWTQANLQQPNHLFAWEWGRRADGSYGILTANGGQHTASDADCDIAFALLMAAHRWHNVSYERAAAQIIPAIWQVEVVPIQGKWYLAADDIEKTASTPYIIVNPSYFAPYEYRVFAGVDPTHPWSSLVKDSYEELQAMTKAPIGTSGSAQLPPGWVAVNRTTGQISPSPTTGQLPNFSYNALRIPWRVALDWKWNHASLAKQTLQSFSGIQQLWSQSGQLLATYSHSGKPLVNYNSYAMYGGTLNYFAAFYPSEAKQIFDTKLYDPLYNRASGHLQQTLNYYDNNWVWFGIELYANQLTNYAKGGSV